MAKGIDRREERLVDTDEERQLRTEASLVAREARELAAALATKAQQPDGGQPTWWSHSRNKFGQTTAPYTRAALRLLNAAHKTLATAMAADRAAGNGWAEIGAALGVSEETAARRYRQHSPGSY